MTRMYRMDDRPDAPSKAAIRCTVDEARAWNTPERGFGIFATVNDFGDAPRRKDNLVAICAWAVDMDDGTKGEMHRKLLASPLVPSIIVETKRGYQAQWLAAPGAKREHWNAIVLERLVPHFGADKNARDLCRILRMPGYLHLKDPSDPFPVRLAWKHQVAYTERQIAEAFRWVPNMDAHRAQLAEAQRAISRQAHQNAPGGAETISEDFWAAIGEIDCGEALERLSGSGYVNGERFTLRPQSNGNRNIYVDGKGTACWVDASGKIGSPSGGGPTIVQWLRWYRHPWSYVLEAIKSVFPHIAEIDERNKARERAAFIAGGRAA